MRDAAAVRNQVAIDSMGRCYHSEEDIKEVTDLAFRMSAAQASRFWNTKNPSKHVTERRVQEWKKYYTDNNRTYYKPSKRGPKEIILPEERDVLEKAFNDIRRSGHRRGLEVKKQKKQKPATGVMVYLKMRRVADID